MRDPHPANKNDKIDKIKPNLNYSRVIFSKLTEKSM